MNIVTNIFAFFTALCVATANSFMDQVKSVVSCGANFLTRQAKSLFGSFVVAVTFATQMVHAAVPTEITDMLTAVGVDAAALIAAGLVVWVAYKGALVVWKIARRILGVSFSG